MNEDSRSLQEIPKLNYVVKDLNDKVDAVYRHGALQEDYSTEVHDYGNGYLMTEVEAHTLGYICDHKETTVTHLAEYSCRTKGTVSKQLKKLEEKGMITRVQKNGNRKWVYFVPTNEGLKANEMHRALSLIHILMVVRGKKYLFSEPWLSIAPRKLNAITKIGRAHV